jgi:drug/metabolite transporter (DMT)-like permease
MVSEALPAFHYSYTKQPHTMIKHIIMVFAGACSFGMLSTMVKLAYHEGYSAADISFFQAFTGMLVLWIWVWITRRLPKNTIRAKQTKIARWPVLLTGAAIGLTTWLYYCSVQYIPASVAIILLMQFTWMGVLIEWWLFRKKAAAIQIITILVILIGTIMASGADHIHMDATFLYGTLYALASALLYALYVVANSRYGNQLPYIEKSATIMTGSAMGILLINGYHFTHNFYFNPGLLKWTAFLALFGTIIPPLLFAKGIPRIGAGISAIIMTAELPVAILCAHLVLHETINGIQWAGIAIMLLAIVWMNWWQLKKHRSAI